MFIVHDDLEVGRHAGTNVGVRQHGFSPSCRRLVLDFDQRSLSAPDAGQVPFEGPPEGAQEISSARAGEELSGRTMVWNTQ